jgi:hypothetical protein
LDLLEIGHSSEKYPIPISVPAGMGKPCLSMTGCRMSSLLAGFPWRKVITIPIYSLPNDSLLEEPSWLHDSWPENMRVDTMLMGLGIFNLVKETIDRETLGIHHINERGTPDRSSIGILAVGL